MEGVNRFLSLAAKSAGGKAVAAAKAAQPAAKAAAAHVGAAAASGGLDISSSVKMSVVCVVALCIGAFGVFVAPPGRKMLALCQHFSAGVVFSAVSAELLPVVMNQNVSATFFGFVAGILGMLALKQFAEKWGNSSAEEAAPLSGVQTLPLATLYAAGVGRVAEGRSQGIVIAISVAVQIFYISIVVISQLVRSGVDRSRVIGITAGLCATAVFGAALGGFFTTKAAASGVWTGFVISFAMASMFWLSIASINQDTPAAAAEAEPLTLTVSFFAGFIFAIILEMAH